MLSEEQIQEIAVRCGKRIKHIVGQDNAWEIVLRAPGRQEYKRFRELSSSSKDQERANAQELHATTTVVYAGIGGKEPPASAEQTAIQAREALQRLLDEYPGIPEACGDAMIELAGITKDALAK